MLFLVSLPLPHPRWDLECGTFATRGSRELHGARRGEFLGELSGVTLRESIGMLLFGKEVISRQRPSGFGR